MALFIDGKRALDSLVVDGDLTIVMPTVVTLQSINAGSTNALSYTFTESGKFQVYGLCKNGSSVIRAPGLTLNGTAIDTQTYSNSAYNVNYAEIEVEEGDIIQCIYSDVEWNGCRQLAVFKNANFSDFNFIGYVPNDGTTFNITDAAFSIEVYNQGYYRGQNNYRYHVVAGEATCVPITGGSDFYYGGTYAIKLA